MARRLTGARCSERGARLAVLAVAGASLIPFAFTAAAAPADPQSRLDETRAQIAHAERRESVLTSTISSYAAKVATLRGRVASLRNRHAAIRDQLAVKQAELARARDAVRRAEARLDHLRDRLRRSIHVLEDRLVAIYKSGQPDIVTVILESDGFEDLVERSEYLQRIEQEDTEVVARVRALEAQVERLVSELRSREAQIRAARDAIAAKERELARTQVALESERSRLVTAQARQEEALGAVQAQEGQLERVEAELEARVREQLAASSTSQPLPAGPVREGSSGMIWPVDGTISSPFGQRWGRLHAGIDIAAPGGTPIRAAQSGRVALAEPYGGYGNYTCVEHGGGLSTCYAHQSGFATSTGAQVDQGEVIGYVGNTGNSFGNHLHFEVRVNGTPQDPLGYL